MSPSLCLLTVLLAALAQPVLTGSGASGSSDAEFEALQRSFVTLYESLRAAGGVAPRDDVVIRVLRQRAAAFTARNRDDPRSLAMELQLSLWLEDEDRINDSYKRLLELTGDLDIGLAWVSYFQRLDNRRRVGEIFTRLVAQFPDEKRILIDWASFYKDVNLYSRALDILEDADLDPEEDPEALIALSTCYFAEHRFPEAVAALESIPRDGLALTLTVQIDMLLGQRGDYPDYWAREQETRSTEASIDDLPRVELVTPRGRIVLELFENEAPNTVANFIALADSGFYDGTTFHRVQPNFMAQGGDPNSRSTSGDTELPGALGTGGPGYRIQDEHDRDGARLHFAGSLSMAKPAGPHTGGSQFFITQVPTAHLNGLHTVFGRVISGLDVARSIEPNEVIESVTVLRKRDHEYIPEKLPESVTLPSATTAPAGR